MKKLNAKMLNVKQIASIATLSLGIAMSSTGHSAVSSPNVTIKGTYAKTQYPILFVHGMFGFDTLGTDTFGMDYFYQVLPDLARNGATTYAAQVSPLESTEVRGEQLLTQVEEVMAITGATKLNLIGHSHGGPTIRYIEAVKPQYVASLTGVGGTFRGSKVADLVLSNNASTALVSAISDYLLGPVITLASSNPSLPISTERSLQSISVAGSSTFNTTYPTPALASSCTANGATSNNGVYYYSWTGTSQLTNVFDLLDVGVSTLAPLAYGSLDNDGLVPRCSARFGKVIRDNYSLTHLDEVNLVLGMRGLFAPDPVTLYRQHANRLKLQGL
ncbi:triacylglycerol lipase [Acinetobacter marinus]|uniref:Triacylglycerol lipase n=1 Tax=Acinetobacter marinus TaxID=281375 RepID=A0A1G6KI51_9GAMM|nr:triacylglycerol lipase [Acinetobacter marinus]SDC30710.1 triacylglycerol lipase [Acinetobacter marinus]